MSDLFVDVHAILLVGLPISTSVLILRLRRRTPTRTQYLIWILVCLLLVATVRIFSVHLCKEGSPKNQWLILGPFMTLAVLFINSAIWRLLTGLVLFSCMSGLSCHFNELVHTSDWTGNPEWVGYGEAVQKVIRYELVDVATKSGIDKLSFDAGWLRDLVLPADAREYITDLHPFRRVSKTVWHSRITGLYRKTDIPQDFWYPGGPLHSSIAKIELRDKPITPKQ